MAPCIGGSSVSMDRTCSLKAWGGVSSFKETVGGGLSTDPGAVQHRGVRKERRGEEGGRRRTRLTGEPVVTVARPTRGRGWAPRSSWGDSAAALQ